ncbi:MAG: hypothetical protein R3B70_27875 [Polyangiaceae bacterium]
MDPRIEASLARALANQDFRDLLERASPAMGLPGPRPRLEVVRELGAAIARDRARGRELARVLGSSEREEARLIACASFAAFILAGGSRRDMLADLQELAEDPRATVRAGVIDAVRTLLADDLATTLSDLRAWTDGFLQAHVALEAIIDRKILATVPTSEPALALLDAAFHLADDAPRAADRWQGVRTLRQGLPAQIAAIAGRFGELFEWVLARAAAQRPETREVMEKTVAELARASFRKSEVDALRDALTRSEKAPRDPSRIVHGTRKRGRR